MNNTKEEAVVVIEVNIPEIVYSVIIQPGFFIVSDINSRGVYECKNDTSPDFKIGIGENSSLRLNEISKIKKISPVQFVIFCKLFSDNIRDKEIKDLTGTENYDFLIGEELSLTVNTPFEMIDAKSKDITFLDSGLLVRKKLASAGGSIQWKNGRGRWTEIRRSF